MEVSNCPELLQIRFLGTMESLESLIVKFFKSLGGLYGLSNLKKLKHLELYSCPVLRVIEGLEELELLRWLDFSACPSLKVLTNLSNSKIPNECRIYVTACKKLPYCFGDRYGDYREEILDWRRRGLNQEGAARFLERGQPLIVQMLEKLEVPHALRDYRKTFTGWKWTGYPSLETLYFHSCLNLRKCDSSVGKMKLLTRLDIIRWTNVVELPDSIKNLKQLKVMRMGFSPIRRLPASIEMLEKLEELYAEHCEQLGRISN
ncbi:uncharacterized protein LOC120291725 [Eucalyptus grandis]|uniref:uncharacterized protein LOC120291725 n=1 Tax=Eucalyptus grandis TaxID=71139 RepID=UPI00192E7690|nr:uncharacterized protein LOC120291725 [Eucalyptus grandis]